MAKTRAFNSVIRPFTAGLLVVLLASIAAWAGGPGFRTGRLLEEHYQKHGAEFGRITKQQYLEFAQEFRDAPKGSDILEVVKSGGVITRFHRKKGWFLAANPDGTIRTFFIPTDGERYFQRQARRP